ncbi:MAG: carbamoyltransferase HypF [bacterium]
MSLGTNRVRSNLSPRRRPLRKPVPEPARRNHPRPDATSLRIRITGQVQGLGFRPHVYRLARTFGVRGTVANTTAGVVILAQGRRSREFADNLRKRPPPLALIATFEVSTVRDRRRADFRIVASRRTGGRRAAVLPDIATCPDCRRELTDPQDRRHGYPFTNCTLCGPRYSIITTLPYDRPNTTMAGFRMCAACRAEYGDPDNRRFHAQPDACPVCGPAVRLLDRQGRPLRSLHPVARAARALAAGRIVAVRSLGGFQLACDASNDTAVGRLRSRKARPTKPLAVMVEDLATAREFCRVGRSGRTLLGSARAPIVLLEKRPRPHIHLSHRLAPDNNRLGVMLAYTPLHLLLFSELRRMTGRPAVLVMTSANHRDEPLVEDSEELVGTLGGVFDLVLTHNRPIANRCDDSVVLADSPAILVRRARGWAPSPIRLRPGFHVKRPVLAVGADMRTCFCLASGQQAWLSPHIGSLAGLNAERFFLETLCRYLDWTRLAPEAIACDLHPDYLSTRLAERLGHELHLPVRRVQHHYAHALAALAPGCGFGKEEDRQSGRTTLALCFDGTGYGTDNAVWGSEFLLLRPDLSWVRSGHLSYLWLTESGSEAPNPARVASGYLRHIQKGNRNAAALQGTPTSSLGRLFDAVAALAGVKRHVTFEGEAAVALEAAVARPERGRYELPVCQTDDGTFLLDPAVLLRSVQKDVARGVAPGRIAARFHRGVIRSTADAALAIAGANRVSQAVLVGGAFQNTLLRVGVARRLATQGVSAFVPTMVPINDGGIALGQAVAVGATGTFVA